MAATQTLELEGTAEPLVNIDAGGYTQTAFNVPASDFSDDEFDLANLLVEYDLDWASLVLSYSHFEGTYERQVDAVTKNRGFAGILENNGREKEGDTIEVRLSSQFDGPLQIIGGIYYEDFELQSSLVGEWYGDVTLSPFTLKADVSGKNGLPIAYEFPPGSTSTLEQKAFFGELIYSLNDQWEFTVGARRFDYDRLDDEQDKFFGATIPATPDLETDETGTVFKANITFSPNDDSLTYLQWSEGFRVGRGQQLPPSSTCDVNNDGKLDDTIYDLDPRVDSDNTSNLELGGKFSFLESRLTLNATLYRVEWEDIPITVFGTTETCLGAQPSPLMAAKHSPRELNWKLVFKLQSNLQLSLSASYKETHVF